MRSFLRAMLGCMVKDCLSGFTETSTLLQSITLPVNYLILLSLFALAGSNAPTAVVLQEQGYYATAFVQAMRSAHSFDVRIETEAEAEHQYQAGTLVSVVTIPASFEVALAEGKHVQIPVRINNLNQDLTDDAARGMRLAVMAFSERNFPRAVGITVAEQDAYPQETGYIAYLAISILVIALLVIGLLQAGAAAAREWEQGTIKELLLAPTSRWAIILGKILATGVIGLPGMAVVLAVVVFLVGWPVNFPLVIAGALLSLLVFASAGVALGMAVKDRAMVTTLSRAVAVPLLFLSGLFGPITYSTGAVQVLARLFPLHYAITLQQFAFKHFVSNTLAPWENGLILGSYMLVFVLLARLAVRLSTVSH